MVERKDCTRFPSSAGLAGQFPETQTHVLQEAAAGQWESFFREYLRPCWRETVLACRQRGLQLHDADDLFQELVLRLMRHGRFQAKVRALLDESQMEANLPARYLKFRELALGSARFRTYLKAVISNLVRETIRKRLNQERRLTEEQARLWEPAVAQSVSRAWEQAWLDQCLATAALAFRYECERARTKGRRRLFEVLTTTLLDRASRSQIARRLDIDPSGVSVAQQLAYERLAVHLKRTTGLVDKNELLRCLNQDPQALFRALRWARNHAQP